jgi:hypothetical protein
VRGFALTVPGNPLTPTLSPNGERERAECAAVRGFDLSMPNPLTPTLSPPGRGVIDSPEAGSACSLSRRERGGVRGFALTVPGNPLTPTLSPNGERERAECAADSRNLP